MKKIVKTILSSACFLAALPFAAVVKVSQSNNLFLGLAQFFALFPGKFGSYLRVGFYRSVLTENVKEAYIGFGSYFSHREVSLGKNVYIGAYCVIGKVWIGNNATIGSGVHILSGKQQHGFERLGEPIQKQRGIFEPIRIGENCWIGSCAVIMADLGRQNVIGAGAVVTRKTEDYGVYAGNPAKLIRVLK